MDSTYKTNKYKLTLLEFVSFTSTQMTYSIFFPLMEYEMNDNVIWTPGMLYCNNKLCYNFFLLYLLNCVSIT